MKLCVIPARGGSKRVPRKNVRPFLGKPIIYYTIKAAIDSALYDEVMVSTEDDEIAQIAQSFGAKVPYKRPANLADDYTTTADVVLNVIDWYQHQGHNIQFFSILYPASPFLTPELLRQGYQRWLKAKTPYCFAACKFQSAPQRGMTMNSNGTMKAMFPENRNVRTQDIEEVYYDTGLFYFLDLETYQKKVAIHSEASSTFILPRHLSHDIDTEEDWSFAEIIYQAIFLKESKG